MTLQELQQQQQQIHNKLAKGWDELYVIEGEDSDSEDESDLVYGLDDEPAHPITEQDLLDVMGPDDNDEIDPERNTVTAELRRGGREGLAGLGKRLLAAKQARQECQKKRKEEAQNTHDDATVVPSQLEHLRPLAGGVNAMQLAAIDLPTIINPNRVQPILASFKNASAAVSGQTLVQRRIAALQAKLNSQRSFKRS